MVQRFSSSLRGGTRFIRFSDEICDAAEVIEHHLLAAAAHEVVSMLTKKPMNQSIAFRLCGPAREKGERVNPVQIRHSSITGASALGYRTPVEYVAAAGAPMPRWPVSRRQ